MLEEAVKARQGGLRNQIPIRTHNWDTSRPGFMEADTVAHCDNGSEFLNHHLLRYFTDHKPKVKFTRSRPCKKNDNAHFCPTLKLLEKKRINSPPGSDLDGKYYKKYETSQTPYQRLMESPQLSKERKGTLRKQHQTLDPFDLKRQIAGQRPGPDGTDN